MVSLWSCKPWEGQMSISELTRTSQAQGEDGGGQPRQEWGGEVSWWARLWGKPCSLQGRGSGQKQLILQEAADRPGSSESCCYYCCRCYWQRDREVGIKLRMHGEGFCLWDTLDSGPRWPIMASGPGLGLKGQPLPTPASALTCLRLPRLHLWPPQGGASQTVLSTVSCHSFLPQRPASLPPPLPVVPGQTLTSLPCLRS